ncbi:hypothetical protein [Paracidovorax citrulli]|uniref:Uncharacterized protein n=2 Tax=Paracidovorax citrulli TaxID=80869 RepID=A1TLS3_PARC0|nr:hypothetical protein [Paracidovorax citrulli]ABM31911.1 conserved hypothetical protein [Paracidovorax citrulli AAC00-1]ATG95037.1 hypothetical protein CQB05_14220 [Paracidovorax citrulli]PVY66101.1 hypothetical protein C8E08_3491 [Paracidovorax citrulli]QCX11844.1 hypothetical protein APS58_3053 [Paracidovorax citrulli]REG69726.1 hypothetical protein C8E07_2894 [Paracidovorax citrulli]
MPASAPTPAPAASPAARIAVLGAPGAGAAALVTAVREHAAWPAARARLVLVEPDPGDAPGALRTLRESGCTQAWLMGLDMLPPGEALRQEGHDAALRSLLQALGWGHHVFYGNADARLRHALMLAGAATPERLQSPGAARPALAWSCEKCSDPECEHRLFQRLLTPTAAD